MNYPTESDHHLRKTVRSLVRTLGLLAVLAVELTSVYVSPPHACEKELEAHAPCATAPAGASMGT